MLALALPKEENVVPRPSDAKMIAVFFSGLAPKSATAPRARVQTPRAREGAQQLSSLNLRTCPPHAARYHEPRTGDSAHVQSRTSRFSPPASNACAPHARHDKRDAYRSLHSSPCRGVCLCECDPDVVRVRVTLIRSVTH